MQIAPEPPARLSELLNKSSKTNRIDKKLDEARNFFFVSKKIGCWVRVAVAFIALGLVGYYL